MKRKTFNVNEDTDKIIAELKKYFGSLSEAETIRNAITFCYSKTVGKDYIQVQKERLEKIKKPVLKEDEEEIQVRICDKLKGEIKTGNNGRKFCEYKVYTKMAGGDYEENIQTTPLEDLTDGHVTNQYRE